MMKQTTNKIFSLGENSLEKLQERALSLAKDNPSAHFLIDEAHFGPKGLKSDFLQALNGQIQEDSFFWVACQKDKPPADTTGTLIFSLLTFGS